MRNKWMIKESTYNTDKELLTETLFTLSNGNISSRGTLEEGHYMNNKQYFGTYTAGIFDKYNKDYQAIVNLPYIFNTQFIINGISLDMTKGRLKNYKRYLNMYNGTLVRSFLWDNGKKQQTEIKIMRFISKNDPHLAVLHCTFKPLNYNGCIDINNVLDGNVANIDFHISGYQLCDEKYYFIDKKHDKGKLDNGGYLSVNTRTTKESICEAFKCEVYEDGDKIKYKSRYKFKELMINNQISFKLKKGKEYTFFKPISVYTSKDKAGNLKKVSDKKLKETLSIGFEKLLYEHERKWEQIWESSDIQIEGNKRDDKNVRFNLFHIIQMGNKNNPYVNVGSRGLTSEMHYGSCFWDTEIFIMPFFIYSDPDTAKALIKYRYFTLPEARKKAKALWFKGAMFPWMSSYPGKEQADYWEYANIAVHIVSDVAYGVVNYYRVTGDMDFMKKYGLEILIETARFWASRVFFNKRLNKYVINNVKGPNEYDGVVNNNTYTNWSAKWNIQQAKDFVFIIKKTDAEQFNKISKKLDFNIKEVKDWTKIINNIYINYDKKMKLYIEDDSFMDKRPVDLKKMKPGKKITTELGLTWDTIIRHKVVKQADVLLLMCIHNEYFTQKERETAYKYYEPLTLHDSSLSYNTHSIIAAELGMKKISYDYFQQTVRLDIDDIMKNAFLGMHAANAGGAWQCVVNGFCGMRQDNNSISFKPSFPKEWKSVSFKLIFRDNLFKIYIKGNKVSIELVRELRKNKNSKVKIIKNKIIKL